jgi:hypothetical protein
VEKKCLLVAPIGTTYVLSAKIRTTTLTYIFQITVISQCHRVSANRKVGFVLYVDEE